MELWQDQLRQWTRTQRRGLLGCSQFRTAWRQCFGSRRYGRATHRTASGSRLISHLSVSFPRTLTWSEPPSPRPSSLANLACLVRSQEPCIACKSHASFIGPTSLTTTQETTTGPPRETLAIPLQSRGASQGLCRARKSCLRSVLLVNQRGKCLRRESHWGAAGLK